MSQKNNKNGGAKKGTSGKQSATGKQSSPGKQGASAKKPAQPQQAAGRNKVWVFVVAAAVLAVIVYAVTSGAGGAKTGGGVTQPSAEEAKYVGRLLPAGYQEPAVAEAQTYTSTIEMADLTAATSDTQVTIPLADVANAKIAHFNYQGTNGTIPLIAYVKPSGKLFVGVSFCPPCQGEWQTIQADGTLQCNSCGTKRDLETQAGISGACKLYPLDELPATVTNGSINVDRAVLDSWTPQPLDRKIG